MMLTDNLTLLSKPTSFPLEGLHSSTMEQAYLIFIRKSIHYLTIKKKKITKITDTLGFLSRQI